MDPIKVVSKIDPDNALVEESEENSERNPDDETDVAEAGKALESRIGD